MKHREPCTASHQSPQPTSTSKDAQSTLCACFLLRCAGCSRYHGVRCLATSSLFAEEVHQHQQPHSIDSIAFFRVKHRTKRSNEQTNGRRRATANGDAMMMIARDSVQLTYRAPWLCCGGWLAYGVARSLIARCLLLLA